MFLAYAHPRLTSERLSPRMPEGRYDTASREWCRCRTRHGKQSIFSVTCSIASLVTEPQTPELQIDTMNPISMAQE